MFANSHASGSAAYDVPPGDHLVAVLPHAAGDHALLHSAHGQALRIDLDRLRPVKSPVAGGVAGMRLDAGDEIVAVTLARDDERVLVVHGSGHAKIVPVELYPVKGRGTGGVQSAAPDVPRREPAGLVATACALPEHASALVLTLSGAIVEVAATALEAGARADGLAAADPAGGGRRGGRVGGRADRRAGPRALRDVSRRRCRRPRDRYHPAGWAAVCSCSRRSGSRWSGCPRRTPARSSTATPPACR